jgi:hypothetical protein
LITHVDEGGEGPEPDADDPFLVVLRPAPGCLPTPPGRYEQIRRAASRRRLLRTAAGACLTVAVAGLVALPFLTAESGRPAAPTVPMAPPAATAERSTPPATDRPATQAPLDPAPAAPIPSEEPTAATPTASPSTDRRP